MAVGDGGILKVVVESSGPSESIAQNVYYWQVNDPSSYEPTNTQIMTALDTKLTAMFNDIASTLSNAYTWEDFTVVEIEWNVDKWETVEDLGTEVLNETGGSANDAPPHGVASVITAYTTRPQTRARKFFQGHVEGDYEDSVLSGALLTALSALVVEWLTDQAIVVGRHFPP